jgi:hypothetical protein
MTIFGSMHGEPRGGNRRIVLLLPAIGRASPFVARLETTAPKAHYIRSNETERAVFICL